MKRKITIAVLLLCMLYGRVNAQLPFVYNLENTGASCPPPPLPTKNQLTPYLFLPDPFKWANGSGRSTSFSDWECHRNEFRAEIENYEIGIKPPRPSNITAAYVPGIGGGRLTVVVIENGKTVTLTSNITLPSSGTGPFPALIAMSLAPGAGPAVGSLNSSLITSRPIATVEYVHNQVTEYAAGQQIPHAADPFYQMYPQYSCPGNSGQYAAWIWGVSRLIDGMYIAKNDPVNPLPIDLSHLAVTGCSYAGKMALYAGAFDERIALTISQENGGGGANSWRYNRTQTPGTVECLDNTDYSWFSQDRLRQFRGDTVFRLPQDHHMLMAMCLPRALLETGNTDFTWLGNPSNYVDAMATKEIYRTLGIGDRFGFYIDGGHGHCTMPSNQNAAVGAFLDKFLLGMNTVNTDTVMIRPQTQTFDTVNYSRWYADWGNVILPVQLKKFSADRSGANVLLKWTVASEQNNKGFQVQSSADGAKWKNVFFVTTKARGGNSSAEISYEVTDVNNTQAITYYRIVQTDNDNKQSISESRLVKGSTLTSKITVYPNPSLTGDIRIAFSEAGKRNILVFNAAGKTVRQTSTDQISIQVTNLKSGSYTVQVNNEEDGSKSSYKVVVMR